MFLYFKIRKKTEIAPSLQTFFVEETETVEAAETTEITEEAQNDTEE
jgi:hypothetical protein